MIREASNSWIPVLRMGLFAVARKGHNNQPTGGNMPNLSQKETFGYHFKGAFPPWTRFKQRVSAALQ
jgi:hypothetical protein